jgi:cysteine synthase A
MAEGILGTIGDTPLVPLRRFAPADASEIWVKLETVNPTGSMKDRMALAMIEGAMERGELARDGCVIEWTGGSAGSSLAMVCASIGLRAHLVSSDAYSEEKLNAMRALGAELDVVPSDGGAITAELSARMQARVDELNADPDTFWTDQFHNVDNRAAYHALGREVLRQTMGAIEVFVMGVGTGGAFSGTAEALKEARPFVRCVAVEPDTSRNLSGGALGGHRIEGIGIGYPPPLFRRDLADRIEQVTDEEARAAVRRLAATEGILAGVSSGANLAVALARGRQPRSGHTGRHDPGRLRTEVPGRRPVPLNRGSRATPRGVGPHW